MCLAAERDHLEVVNQLLAAVTDVNEGQYKADKLESKYRLCIQSHQGSSIPSADFEIGIYVH